MRHLFRLGLLLCLVIPATRAVSAENLVKNGGFDTANDIGLPDGWTGEDVEGMSIAEEKGNTFLRVVNGSAKRQPNLQQTFAIPPGSQKVTLQARLRCADLKPGELHWQTGRVAGQFLDEQGEVLRWLTAAKLPAASKDWVEAVRVTDVPEGTASVRLMAGLFFATGTLDVDNVTLKVGDHAPAEGQAAPDVKPPGPVPVDALDGDNLLPNGSFEQLEGGKPTHWHIPGAGIRVVEEGDAHFLRVDNERAGSMRVATLLLKIDPAWQRLKLSGKLRSTELAPSDLHWQTGRVAFTYLDKDQKVLKYKPHLALTGPSEGWESQEVLHDVPIGAVYLRVEAGMFQATGHIEVDDITIARADEQAQVVPLWGQEPVEVETDLRATVCLNGPWRFRPVEGVALEGSDTAVEEGGKAEKQPAWGWAAVPGSWHRLPTWKRPGLMRTHRGPVWNAFLAEPRAWVTGEYRRELTVPEDWADRRIAIDLAFVVSVAEVWIDDTFVGRTEHGFGEVDITDHVKPGSKQQLVLRVHALPDEAAGLILMGETVEQLIRKEKLLNELGLIGDVLLTARPHGPHVADVFVETSVREKAATLRLALDGWQDAKQVEITAVMLDETGKPEREFAKVFELNGETKQALSMRCDWPEPRLWDVGQPNLYTLDLKVKPVGADQPADHLRQRFGFREFWVEGRYFMLNGTRINLRPGQYHAGWPHLESIDRKLRTSIAMGFNLSHTDGHTPGATPATGMAAQRADELGHMLVAWTPNMAPLMVAKTWDDADTRMAWQRRMSDHLRRLRNHPSIVLWATSANAFSHGQDQNPRYLGNSKMLDIRDEDPKWWRRARPGVEAVELIKAKDPTRPAYAHSGSFVGDIQNTNMYLNLLPLQEREEWLSAWAQHGDRPFMAGEFGLPLNNTWTRGKAGGGWTSRDSGSLNSQTLMTEYMASYIGPRAYAMESKSYRATIPAKHQGGEVYRYALGKEVAADPAHHALLSLYIRNTWRSWRTWGVSGGTVPWAVNQFFTKPKTDRVTFDAFMPGRRGEYVAEYPPDRMLEMAPEYTQPMRPAQTWMAHNRETLMWIAGHHVPDDPASFTDKTHHYRAGKTLNKQLILINDARTTLAYNAAWELLRGETVIAAGAFDGEIAPGEQARQPLSVSLPEVDKKTRLTLRAQATIGEQQHHDTFDLTVFPAHGDAERVLSSPLELVDPVGHTTRMLETLNIKAADADNDAQPLIVLGREALSSGRADLASYEAGVKDGATLLIMAQHPDWLRERLGLRVAPYVTRRVFATQPGHPVLEGIGDDALRDWAGTNTLVEPKPVYPVQPGPKGLRYYAGKPIHGWRWGNRHGITSAAVEKPHHAGWRAILDAEFDLAYSPLMELRYGKGRVILCTLDLEDHVGVDPVADRLAAQLLAYASVRPILDKTSGAGRTVYLGDDTGRKPLESMGLVLAVNSEDLDSAGLIVLGPSHGLADVAIQQQLAAGRNILALPMPDYPLGLTAQAVADFPGSLDVPAWEQVEGLGASVFRRHVDQPARLFQASEGYDIASGGMLARTRGQPGVLLATQFDPAAYDTDAMPYLRYTRWRDTRALAVVLSNLGATFEANGLIFRGNETKDDHIRLDGPWQAVLTHPLPPSASPNQGHPDPGITDLAKRLITDDGTDEAWREVQLPAEMETLGDQWVEKDGEAVFRKTITVPERFLDEDLVLQLGPIDDFDRVYLNGQLVGETGINTESYWSLNRRYPIKPGILKAGENTIVIRAFDRFGGGGVMPNPKHPMMLGPAEQEDSGPKWYHPDYRDDFAYGDDPYRYYRW